MRLSFVGYALGIPSEFLSRFCSNDFLGTPAEFLRSSYLAAAQTIFLGTPVEFLRSSCGVPSVFLREEKVMSLSFKSSSRSGAAVLKVLKVGSWETGCSGRSVGNGRTSRTSQTSQTEGRVRRVDRGMDELDELEH